MGRIVILAVAVLLVMTVGIETPLASALEIEADQQLGLAEKLFERGDYSGAITEYERFIHFFPLDARITDATFKIGLACFHSRDFNRALKYFQSVIKIGGTGDLAVKAHMQISECFLNLNAPQKSLAVLENLAGRTTRNAVKDEAYYRIGWIYVDQEAWEKARTAFERISKEGRAKYNIDGTLQALARSAAIPKKDPALAGLFSLIPGAGYLYTERYQDALTAFLVNGALIFAAYESFDKDLYALGGILTAVEIGFYSGNIYGSIGSAHKYNRAAARSFIQDIENEHKILIFGGLQPDGVCLALRYSF